MKIQYIVQFTELAKVYYDKSWPQG